MFGWMSAENHMMHRPVEPSGAFDGGASGTASGLLSGTRLATGLGWRPVETLTVGDQVLTFDSGLQPITQIDRKPLWIGTARAPRKFLPLRVPAGALGNREAMDILPQQFVMIESDAAEELFGDPFSIIKAKAFDGIGGIESRSVMPGEEAIVLHFANEEIVFDRSGTLFYCPSGPDISKLVAPRYTALSEAQAEILMVCIECDAATGDLCNGDIKDVAPVAA